MVRERWKAINASSERWSDTWVLFILAVMMLFVTIFGMQSFLAASNNEGTWGTFTAIEHERRPCGRGGCDWVGVFTSDDGSIHNEQATYDAGIDRVGDQVRVQSVGGEGNDLYEDHDRTWLLFLLLDVPCLLYLAWWFRVRRWRGPRAQQTA